MKNRNTNFFSKTVEVSECKTIHFDLQANTKMTMIQPSHMISINHSNMYGNQALVDENDIVLLYEYSTFFLEHSSWEIKVIIKT